MDAHLTIERKDDRLTPSPKFGEGDCYRILKSN
jgi:hypothetical protein